MAEYSRVGYYGWDQGDDSAAFSRVTSNGWEQVDQVGATEVELAGAAVAGAVGSATLQAINRVWRMPINAANGTQIHSIVMNTSAGPVFSIAAQGTVVVANGFVDLPGSGTPGTKKVMHFDTWDQTESASSILGGVGMATLTDI